MALQTFQQDFYLTQNPDVFAAVRDGLMTAEEHYVKYGELEGRQPNPYFDPTGYIAANQDVVPAVASGIFSSFLSHFELNGVHEGRQPGATNSFNETNYLAENPDVKEAVDSGIFSSGYAHYVLHGAGEPGRGNGVAVEPPDPSQGQDFTLTTGQDLFPENSATGNAGADTIRGVAGQFEGAQDQTTLNSSDIIDGGVGDDRLVVNMTGDQYLGGATIKSIETLQIGTNLADHVVAFDMNVNQGAYEVTNVNTLDYDQITTTETLVVQNVVPVDPQADAADLVVPNIIWANEAGSAAGTIATTYRQLSINGAADNQSVELVNVDATQHAGDGVLAIGAGIESITIISSGAVAQNTLNDPDYTGSLGETAAANIGNIDYNDTGDHNGAFFAGYQYELDVAGNTTVSDTMVVGSAADLVSRGSLTSVILQGGTAIGKGADVIVKAPDAVGRDSVSDVWLHSVGLTDRWVSVYNSKLAFTTTGDTKAVNPTADGGITNAFGDGTASNLLSVGSRVTTVDASGMNANTFIRFVPKDNDSASDKTFIGGKADDYVEFETGNVTATGDTGADTFAFVNSQPKSAFSENDKLTGGEGEDTIQLGLNGFGNYTISQTELRNKTGIDVLDLRGDESNVTLSSDFVSSADEAGRITVHTDRIVRTSNEDDANSPTQSNQEDTSTHIVDLTFLGSTDGVTYKGGSGSDRLILNDATFNVQQVLDGGLFDGYASRNDDKNDLTKDWATAGDYNTLTVTTNGEQVVLDARDLSGVNNFDGLVLTKNSATATYDITLTQSFLYANTSVQDEVTDTETNDTIFQIGTIAAANQFALNAGDTVEIDVSDLLSPDNTKLAVAGFVRKFDVTSLEDAGVTINFFGHDHAEILLPALQALSLAARPNEDPVGRTDVLMSTPHVKEILGNNLIAQGAGFDTASGFLLTGGLATAQNDTLTTSAENMFGSNIKMAGGIDTLNITTDAVGKDASGLATADAPEIVNLEAGATGAGFTNANGAGFTVNAKATSIVKLGTGGQSFNGSAGSDTVTTNTGADTVKTGDGADQISSIDTAGVDGDTIDAGAGNDTILISAGNQVVDASSGADVVFVELSGTDDVSLGVDGDADNVLIQNEAISDADTSVVTIHDFNIANDSISLGLGVFGVVPTATSSGLMIHSNTTTSLKDLAIGTVLAIDTADASSGATADQMLTYMTKTLGVTAATDSKITVVAYDAAGNASLYQAQDTNGAVNVDGVLAFDDIELVGVVQGVGVNALTADNFG